MSFSKMCDQKDHLSASKDSKSSLFNDCENENCETNDVEKCLQTNVKEEFLICNTCKKSFLQYSDLKRHSRTHLPSICHICKKGFSSFALLKKHERSHSSPYVCNICGKTFSKMRKLKLHLSIHSDHKPYACNICGKAFSVMSNLKIHFRIHSGDKPYVCALCNRGFTQMQHLKRHCELHCKVRLLVGDLHRKTLPERCPLKVPPKSQKVKPQKVKSQKKVVKPCFWDTLRKGFSKSYLKDRRQAMGKNETL